MTVLGVIGSGRIGGTVARLAAAAGYEVVVSNSRGPETLAGLVAQLGSAARAGTREEAAAAGDLVVVSIPFKAYTSLPRSALVGKTVLDTGNYYAGRDGAFPSIESGERIDSEIVQEFLGGAHVVKVFNNIFSAHLGALARPHGAGDRTALPIAGDDGSAKREAAAFLDAIGYDAVDAGPLAEGWRFAPGTPVYGNPYSEPKGADFARLPAGAAPVALIEEGLAAATR